MVKTMCLSNSPSHAAAPPELAISERVARCCRGRYRRGCASAPCICPNTQMGLKTNEEGPKHAFYRIFHRCEWSKCQKKSVSEMSIFLPWRVEYYIGSLCPSSLGSPPSKHLNRVKNT